MVCAIDAGSTWKLETFNGELNFIDLCVSRKHFLYDTINLLCDQTRREIVFSGS